MAILEGISYTDYRSMIDKLLAKNKTTGENHSEAMLEYTKMNVHRMSKWDKTIALNDELVSLISKIDRKLKLVTFTEAWCGDAAHNVPIIEKIAQASDNIEHQLLLRDENEEAFAPYLYHNTKSIPRTVFFDADTNEELAVWGPRPAPVQNIVEDNKKTQALDYAELNNIVHLWYAKDKSHTIQTELLQLLNRL